MKPLVKIKRLVKRSRLLEDLGRRVFKKMPVVLRSRISEISECPYSTTEEDNKVIFVHVPKTGGNAVCKALFGSMGTGHIPLSCYRDYDYDLYSKSFKFAFVRNPWDRFVSAYFYLAQGGVGLYDKEFSDKYIRSVDSFEEFVFSLENKKFRSKILAWPHFRPQIEYICPHLEPGLDFLGRFEYIDRDYQKLGKILGSEAIEVLEKVNVSKRNSYKSYYSDYTRRVVEDAYQKDIEYLGYTF